MIDHAYDMLSFAIDARVEHSTEHGNVKYVSKKSFAPDAQHSTQQGQTGWSRTAIQWRINTLHSTQLVVYARSTNDNEPPAASPITTPYQADF